MAFEKAARGETKRLWRVEVLCALAFVRAELQPSVWCVCAHVSVCISVCGSVCMCHHHKDGTHSKDYEETPPPQKVRETGDDIMNQGCSLDTMKLHLSVHITLTILFSTAEQGFSVVSVWRETSIIQVKRGENVPTVQRKGNSLEKKWCKHEWSEYKVQIVEPCRFVRRLVGIHIHGMGKTGTSSTM